MTTVVVAPRAETQIRRIGAWWRENRLAAPELFTTELADLLEAVVTRPTRGAEYGMRRGVMIRRLLLPRSRHHVYFSYDEDNDILEVRAVWHAARGQGPRLD